MQLCSFVLVVAQVHTIFTATAANQAKPRNVRPQKPINWNITYYSEPFGICKTLRKLNPVEQVRYHGVAVDIFRTCGPRMIIPYASQHNFPAYGECSKTVEVKALKLFEHFMSPQSVGLACFGRSVERLWNHLSEGRFPC